jgi:hypothetical protein
MIDEIKKVKKVKDAAAKNRKVVANHTKAATHLEAAAVHLKEAAKQFEGGNKDTACGCSMKAKGQTSLAQKLQKKILKKYATAEK